MKTKIASTMIIPLFYFLLFFASFLGDGKQSAVDVYGAAIVLVLWMIRLLQQKPIVNVPSKLFIPWVTIFVAAVISSAQSSSLGFSISWVARLFGAFLLYWLFYDLASLILVRLYIRVALIFVVLMCVMAGLFIILPQLGVGMPSMNLLINRFGHNHIADILVFVTPLLWLELVDTKRSNWVSTCGWSLFLIVLMMSYARGALIIVGTYLFIAVLLNRKTTRRFLVSVMLLFVFCVSTWSLLITKGFNVGPIALVAKQQTVVSRIEYWRQALDVFKVRPLLGYGPGTFSLASVRFQGAPNHASWFVHNEPLQIIAEMGILGGIVFGWLFVVNKKILFGRAPAASNPADIQRLIESGILLLIYGCIEFTLDYLVTWFMFWTIIGLSVGVVYKQRNTSKG